MRASESAYWDRCCEKKNPSGAIVENFEKQAAIASRLLRETWIGQTALEIGVGNGIAQAAVRILYGALMDYAATDVSKAFCDHAKRRFGIRVYHTDICHLPDSPDGFSRVLALDTFEHVHPDDREAGWAELARVMAPQCRLFINISLDASAHDEEFDHPFGLRDLADIGEACRMRMDTFEKYKITLKNVGEREYAWVVLER